MKQKLTALLSIGSALGLALAVFLVADAHENITPAAFDESVATSDLTQLEEPVVCSNLLEQDENAVLVAEYGTLAVADCMFVGCGGIF